tara:strand:+ start:250 stop:369 length:120 start_codon:yes stop_codon:yes gene_type:complete
MEKLMESPLWILAIFGLVLVIFAFLTYPFTEKNKDDDDK